MESYVVAARDSGVYPDAAFFKVGGGVATWFSAHNLLNGSIGLGMTRHVELEEVVALEAFYRERGSRPVLDLCPLADPSLTRWVTERGFVPISYENVLARSMDDGDDFAAQAEGLEVLVGEAVDRRVWFDLEARGFTEDQPTEEDYRVANATSRREDATRVVVMANGVPAGAGMVTVDAGLGHLNGDSTLPAFRGRGVQQAAIAARLRCAREAGADVVYVETAPGSGSQRNMERMGFRVLYTRVTLAARES